MKIMALPWVFLTGIPLTLLGGVILSDYWSWFIARTFNIAPITYLQAVGILLFVGLFKIGLKRETPEENDHPVATIFIVQGITAVVWLISWGVGAVWSLFI